MNVIMTKKSKASVNTHGWMTVWEGAIRSGKTVASIVAWLRYVALSNEHIFFMSGKTYASLIRNVIDGEYGLLNLARGFVRMTKDRSGSTVLLMCSAIGEKKIHLFGASDDAAYMRIKGLTAGGWYADEVATHPESFIVEALSRTAVSTDRRIFWTLNPAVPSHYIYKRFLDKWESEKSPGYVRFHYTLADNPAMTPERRAELESQYSGRYKMMYIYGKRCAAEGVIYDSFKREMVYSRFENEKNFTSQFIACDYGTINPCVFLECAIGNDGKVYVLREKRWDSRKEMQQKTDEQYVEDMVSFIGEPEQSDIPIIVDPSASSFITALKMRGYFVINGKNDVLPGIRRVSSLFAMDKIRIHESCTGLISELELYIWDDKASLRGEEKPLKTNDHAPDALRYYCMTALTAYDIAEMGLNNE